MKRVIEMELRDDGLWKLVEELDEEGDVVVYWEFVEDEVRFV